MTLCQNGTRWRHVTFLFFFDVVGALYHVALHQNRNAVFIWSAELCFIFVEQIHVIFMRPHYEAEILHDCLVMFIWVYLIWAPSSEFVSSSIPSWQISTAHAQPFIGARDLAFCLRVPLDSLLLWASSEGSGETARMRRLAWTFAARIGDKYQIRLTRSIYPNQMLLFFGLFPLFRI